MTDTAANCFRATRLLTCPASAALRLQGAKSFSNQAPLASLIPLRPAGGGGIIDVCVVGAGPAGLSLAAELGLQGLQVALVAPDSPFINTHACWLDELDGLSLDHTFNTRWESAVCYFKETPQPTRLPRPYIRFSRHKLRAHLAERCAAAGVRYAAGEVADIDSSRQASEGWVEVRVAAAGAAAPVGVIRARMAVVAAGAAGTRYIKYEARSPPAAIQSAYGIYAELEGYERWCDPSAMNFQVRGC